MTDWQKEGDTIEETPPCGNAQQKAVSIRRLRRPEQPLKRIYKKYPKQKPAEQKAGFSFISNRHKTGPATSSGKVFRYFILEITSVTPGIVGP